MDVSWKTAFAGRRSRLTVPRNPYMHGKCLWKMYIHASEKEKGDRKFIEVGEVIEAFMKAVQILADHKDSRQDLILEPHFKLVSVVHKLVHQTKLRVRTAH